MRKFLLALLLLYPLVGVAQQPASKLRPCVWLRADQPGKRGAAWEDKSKNKRDAVPSPGFARGADSLINFNRAVAFNGRDSWFSIPLDLGDATQLTVITVYRGRDTVAERAVWGAPVSPRQEVALSTQRSTGPTSIARYAEENITVPVVNTTSHYWGKKHGGMSDASFLLGGSVAEELPTFSGEVAEFMVFDRLLGGSELQSIETYLSLKYGITLQYADYVTSKGEVIWDYEGNSEYSYAVAGIGQDKGWELHQKQSSSAEAPGVLTLGAGGIAPTNDANRAAIKNGNFLVWGMNDAPPVLEFSESPIYPYERPILKRRWRMQATQHGAKGFPTELRFNVAGLAGGANGCYLAIDRSGRGDFSPGVAEYLPADAITSDGVAVFRDVYWDVDRSGSDIFTLAFGLRSGATCTHPLCRDEATGRITLQVMGGCAPYSFRVASDSLGFAREWTGESRFQEVAGLWSGRYLVAVTDRDGSTTRETITISNPAAFSLALEESRALRPGEALTIDAGQYVSTPGATFAWAGPAGFSSAGSVVTLTAPGVYTLTATSPSGCARTATVTVEAAAAPPAMPTPAAKPTAVAAGTYSYRLYPNPTAGDYGLALTLGAVSPVAVRVYNAAGALLRAESGEGAASYVFEGRLDAPGLYLVEVETDFGRETFKLIVSQ